ncbi:acetylornithine aminotransferase [Emiliania huxleyi CCMP1516]|uniref:Acetylornithine aminotransferase n=4 Tax=Emiliania huxleyi TaxID=2903 RepID=A0A0D3I7K4_EMIH1|nr:acetylornithine aminotransferase [Emiliania huxleyi CCMP1516]EOD07239.1 acetylornithine aminotransferase [Emiliania huxleyi CCMP1516]|eukprot:XP_005759668.1 acetylornithine aminotransferase [Emiliania huxleyi CCMP1516]
MGEIWLYSHRRLATLTATGQPKYQEGFGPLPDGFAYVEYNDVDELRALVKSLTRPRRHQRLGVEVDVLTSAKALGGGASCDVLTPGTHASTFGGNPLACAAANAVLQASPCLRAIEDDGVLANVNARSAQLVSGLEALRSKREGVIAEVRGWGLLLGVELTAECGFTAAQLTAAAMRNGLLTVPAGEKVLRLVPPLIVSAEQADRAVGILDASMAELMAGQRE